MEYDRNQNQAEAANHFSLNFSQEVTAIERKSLENILRMLRFFQQRLPSMKTLQWFLL